MKYLFGTSIAEVGIVFGVQCSEFRKGDYTSRKSHHPEL
jgi:hypothetical protein